MTLKGEKNMLNPNDFSVYKSDNSETKFIVWIIPM